MPDTIAIRYLDRTSPPHISTLILVTSLSALTINIFLPSLPKMTEHFETDYRVMQLSVALFLAVNAAMQIVIGPISDSLGRRPVLLWGTSLYVLATLGCIFAPTATIFLVFRSAQAVIAVGMVLSRAAVRDMYTQDKAGSMIGYVTMGMAVVPMVGPVVGGVLDEVFGWEANFWLLTLVGVGATALIWSDFGETAKVSGKSLLQQIREYPELLRSPRFWGYSLAVGFASGSFFVFLGGAPYVGTEIYGLTPSQLGFYFGAPAVGYFFGNFITGRFAMRFGINSMILWGSLVIAGGLLASILILLSGHGSAYTFFGFMTFVGLGNGMAIPNATAGALSVRPHLAGTASGLSGAIMLGGGAALSALAGAMLTPGTGAVTLVGIMLATACCALLSIFVVLWRERQLAR